MSRTQLSLLVASTIASVALAGCMGVRAPEAVEYDAVSAVVDQAERVEPEAPIEAPSEAIAEAEETEDAVSRPAPSSRPKPASKSRADSSRLMLMRGGPAQPQRNLASGGGDVAVLGGMGTGAAMAPPPPQPSPVVTEGGYRDYGVNGFELAANDHLSTFAIDVDTASYTMARKSLNASYLPAQGAVRVEEFVNYFPYEYARPSGQDPFGVDFEAAPSPWDESLTVVRIGVQGKQVRYEERKPVHLTFLVDTSGSMRSRDKLDLVKKSLLMLSEELEDGDTVAVATYAGSTRVVLPPTSVTNRRAIERSLSGLTAGGSTAMSSGIDLAYQLADQGFEPGSVNRVIVCSDGDANVGRTGPDAVANQVKGYAQKGITLTTLGFGNGNYKDTMMERLANQGDGNYFYIDGEREAQRVLVDKLSGTLEVIAKDVKIQVDWNPEAVHAYRLIGYENRDVADRDFRNDKVDAGEIGAGHQVTALYEVATRPGASGELANVRVRNKAPGADAPAVERSWTLPMTMVKPAFSETSRQYRIASSAAYFADILRGSEHMSEISLSQVAEMAEDAQRREYAEDKELVTLIRKAAHLRGEGRISMR